MPKPIILPIIFVLCVVGSYAISQRLFDVWVMLGFGVLGYVLRRNDYPVAPLVLGMVLGDLMEKGFRRGLVLSDGSLTPFFTRPISAVLWITIAIVMVAQVSRGTCRPAQARSRARLRPTACRCRPVTT